MAGRSRWRHWVLKVFTIIGAITCGLFALGVVSMVLQCGSQKDVEARTVLELDLERELAEVSIAEPFLEVLGDRPSTLRDVVETLDRAAKDDRVAGLIAYVGATNHGAAKTQELRDAIERFRGSGKFAIAFAESFGEMSPGNQGYYLATACDEVWLQPTGSLGLTGLLSSSMFVKGTLEKLDIKVAGDRRKEFKNAFNMFTERRYTDAHREASQTLIDDTFAQMVAGIAERRGLGEVAVRDLVDKGPYIGSGAVDAGLIDGVAYRDEVLAKAKERAGDKSTLLYTHKYLERAGRPHDGSNRIALVYGVGGVTRGSGGFDPITGGQSMGSDSVNAALRAAVADDDVKAIVFRVDSPGGSAVASDAIWREVGQAREAGKPVVVSMGNVAASGGYYVSAGADKIVAQPGTITGSIGVFGGKPVTRALWNKFGITFDAVKTSRHAAMYSTLHEFSPEEWERIQAWLDWVYSDFKTRVADGRGLTAEQVEAVAKGRVWTGVRAKELGLVDALGGLETAVTLAKQEAGLEEDDEVELRVYPAEKNLLERYLSESPDSSEDRSTAAQARVQTALDPWRPVLRRLTAAGLGPQQPGVLTMPPLEIGP